MDKTLEGLIDGLREKEIPMEIAQVPGFSPEGTRKLISQLCGMLQPVTYLEAGTFLGATFTAAMFGNKGRFISIDNLSEFRGGLWYGQTQLTYSVEDQRRFIHQLIDMYGQGRASFIEANWRDVPVVLIGGGVSVFFYDAGHSAIDTLEGILQFSPCFADEVVLLVDDYNEEQVQEGTKLALDLLPYDIEEEMVLSGAYWKFGFYAAKLKRRSNGL